MNLSNANQRKFFPKILIRRPVYICLLLLFFSIASIVAQQIQSTIIEKLQKHIFNDKISIPAEVISYADSYGRNLYNIMIHEHTPDYSASDQPLFVIVSPVENGNNEMNVLVTIVEPDFSELPADVFSAEPYANMEIMSNSGLTTEDKFNLIAVLNTLNVSSETDGPISVQSEN